MLATLIAMRLGKNISDTINGYLDEINIVSDSKISLSFIKFTRKLPVFVENQRIRIIKIKDDLESNGMMVKFHHVSTTFNPADAGARGVHSNHIQDHDWVRGPQWLSKYGPFKQLRSISEIRK